MVHQLSMNKFLAAGHNPNMSSSVSSGNLNTAYDNRYGPALSSYDGVVDPQLLEAINPHWMTFSPPEAWVHYTFGIIYAIIMVCGLFGNALVIVLFVKCRSLRTSANILIINLAICDFLMMIKIPVVVYNSFHLGPALGDLACRLYGFVGGLTGTGSILTLTAISVDRYRVIVYPLGSKRNLGGSRSMSYIIILFVWCYSFAFSIVPALNIGLSRYVPEGFLTCCSFDYLDSSPNARLFMFTFFICVWLVPFIVIVYCYSQIVITASDEKRVRINQCKNKLEQQQRKLALIVFCVIGLWFIAWTPYAIVALLGIAGQNSTLTPLISMIPALFCKTAACIDPYLYSLTHPRFKKELLRFLHLEKPQPLGRTSSTRTVHYMSTKRHRNEYTVCDGHVSIIMT